MDSRFVSEALALFFAGTIYVPIKSLYRFCGRKKYQVKESS